MVGKSETMWRRYEMKNGERLKQQRELMQLTQAELAKRSGVDLRSIQSYEQGLRDINKAEAMTVLWIADVLKCDIREIMNI